MKHLGLLTVLILGAGLTFVGTRWPQGLHRSFSQHVAVQRSSIWYYIGLFTLVLPLLWLFFAYWFAPVYQLSAWFLIFIGLAIIFQYAVTLVPEVGNKTRYHRAGAFISAICLLPPLALLLATPISRAAWVVTLTSLAIMVGIMGTTIRHQAQHRYLLLLQSGYYAAFFAAILAVTYLS